MRNEFTAYVADGGDGWFWATSPEVPGANGQGRTSEEAIQDLASAIELMLQYLREEAEAAREPGAVRTTVTVP